MEIRTLVTATVSGVLDQLLGDFEASTGHRVERWDATAGKVRDRLLEGVPADVALVTSSVIGDVEKAGRLVPGSRVELAASPLGIAIRKGAERPSLASVEDLKRLILSARSIALSDPAGGGNSGRYFMGVADRLGVGEELRARTRLYRHGGDISAGVAAGEADFGVTVVSEIVPIPGAAVGGVLPAEVQNVSTTFAALVMGSERQAAGRALIAYLTAPAAWPVIRSCGMEPGMTTG